MTPGQRVPCFLHLGLLRPFGQGKGISDVPLRADPGKDTVNTKQRDIRDTDTSSNSPSWRLIVCQWDFLVLGMLVRRDAFQAVPASQLLPEVTPGERASIARVEGLISRSRVQDRPFRQITVHHGRRLGLFLFPGVPVARKSQLAAQLPLHTGIDAQGPDNVHRRRLDRPDDRCRSDHVPRHGCLLAVGEKQVLLSVVEVGFQRHPRVGLSLGRVCRTKVDAVVFGPGLEKKSLGPDLCGFETCQKVGQQLAWRWSAAG